MALRLRENKNINGIKVKIDSVENIKSHSKESKAFEKSKKIIAPSIL
jgi:hypothetical protein